MPNAVERHDDQQGVLGTAVSGATQWTPAQYRNTGIVVNNIQNNDVFTMIFQFTHRRKLQSALDSVHLHWITQLAVTGTLIIDYTWGWYNTAGTAPIPETLPNTGSVTINIAAADQYIPKVTSLITNLTSPTGESGSSLLFCRFIVNGGTYGGTNPICILYVDAHTIVNKQGTVTEIA